MRTDFFVRLKLTPFCACAQEVGSCWLTTLEGASGSFRLLLRFTRAATRTEVGLDFVFNRFFLYVLL